ncbi:MAG: hypothetical protein ACR2P4_01215 [Gammaproteobacteria bacterium]
MKHITIFTLALLMASCNALYDRDSDFSASKGTNGGVPQTAPQIPFIGDACEYAKWAFVQAHQKYQNNASDPLLYNQQEQARIAAKSICEVDKNDEPKTWACAEGHSCR